MKNNILLNKARIITLFLSMGFYCFFALTEGAVICVDSASYIGMELYREPLYPAFLAFFRWIFGSETNQYLNVAALFQCILAGISTWILIEYAVRLANLASIFRYIFLTVCLSISLLCRFVAQRGSMYYDRKHLHTIDNGLFKIDFGVLYRKKEDLFNFCCCLIYYNDFCSETNAYYVIVTSGGCCFC